MLLWRVDLLRVAFVDRFDQLDLLTHVVDHVGEGVVESVVLFSLSVENGTLVVELKECLTVLSEFTGGRNVVDTASQCRDLSDFLRLKSVEQSGMNVLRWGGRFTMTSRCFCKRSATN